MSSIEYSVLFYFVGQSVFRSSLGNPYFAHPVFLLRWAIRILLIRCFSFPKNWNWNPTFGRRFLKLQLKSFPPASPDWDHRFNQMPSYALRTTPGVQSSEFKWPIGPRNSYRNPVSTDEFQLLQRCHPSSPRTLSLNSPQFYLNAISTNLVKLNTLSFLQAPVTVLLFVMAVRAGRIVRTKSLLSSRETAQYSGAVVYIMADTMQVDFNCCNTNRATNNRIVLLHIDDEW